MVAGDHGYSGLLHGFGLDVVSIAQSGPTELVITFRNLAVPESQYGGRGTYDMVVKVRTPMGVEHAENLPKFPDFGPAEARPYTVDLTRYLTAPGDYGVTVETFVGTGTRSAYRSATLAVALP